MRESTFLSPGWSRPGPITSYVPQLPFPDLLHNFLVVLLHLPSRNVEKRTKGACAALTEFKADAFGGIMRRRESPLRKVLRYYNLHLPVTGRAKRLLGLHANTPFLDGT